MSSTQVNCTDRPCPVEGVFLSIDCKDDWKNHLVKLSLYPQRTEPGCEEPKLDLSMERQIVEWRLGEDSA